MNPTWTRFCVVGLGGHARTKLIPAILANGQKLAGIVSRKLDTEEAGAPIFASLGEAIAALPGDTVFVIASPPTAHFSQALPVLNAGRDMIVEKPPFVTRQEAEEAVRIAERTGALLVEAFMNRHSRTHRHFIDACRAEIPAEIVCAFNIPKVPGGTFRHDPALGSSNLYDIGSYLLAALLDIGLPLEGLSLERVDNAGVPDRERLHIAGQLDGVRVEALIGVDHAYVNRLELRWAAGRSIAYRPFFYGREAEREVIYSDQGATHRETIPDINAFREMFAVAPSVWRATAPERSERMIALTTHLERLGRRLAAARCLAEDLAN